MPLNISSLISTEAKKEILDNVILQAIADIYQVSLELNIDPDSIEETWTAEGAMITDNNPLRSAAERLEFHIGRLHSAKNKLEAL
jgi:hypothetical protein